MFTLLGRDHVLCGGIHRRELLRLGTLGLGGLTLADLLRADAQAKAPRRAKSLIYVVLSGGPSHIDMYDLKPDSPAEYRGPFRPIDTSLVGTQICESMPLQAQMLDKLALIRGIRSVENDHYLAEVYTGLPRNAGQRPAFGSVVGKLSPEGSTLPPYISLARESTGEFNYERPHYIGSGYAPFRPFDEALDDLTPPTSLERLQDRRQLLAAFDQMRRDADRRAFDGLDRFQQQALGVITSPAMREAFDLTKEPAGTLERYGKGGQYTHQTVKRFHYPWDPKPFVLARRLVEAGARVVTVQVGNWDHHSGAESDIFYSLKLMLPALDKSLSALFTDLRERGLDQDVAVVVLGEFGRTPKITTSPGIGREHWADAGCALFFGGGLKMGQVIGATDSRAERSKEGKITFQNVMATMYHVMGVDPTTKLPDFNGRPQYLLNDPAPISELVGKESLNLRAGLRF